ncbi:MAG: nucleoside hydrolase [Bacteroidota bacterium]
MKNRQVIMDHDGSADDFLSLVLLLTMPHINTLGITITPADCYIENALATTLKILAKAKKPDIKIGIGNFHGINAFPADWRAKPKMLNALPSLIGIEVPADVTAFKPANDLIEEQLLNALSPITILMTGPCSNLVHALERNSKIANNIEEVVWMGGAFDVPGNVLTYNHDGTAEWNVFWDPVSAHSLLKYDIPITFIPLDVTNDVPVSIDFLKRLANQSHHFWSNLAGTFWATTLDTIPAYEYTYFMWDVLATSYLYLQEAFTLEEREIDIVPKGASAGKTYWKKGSGHFVKVAKKVDKRLFYSYLLEAFSTDL